MIACDNPDCRYQWVSENVAFPFRMRKSFIHVAARIQFHLPCVNLKPPLPDSWYCEECAGMKKGMGGAVGGGRKGRKK